MSLGTTLRVARETRGLGLRELAKLVGTDPSYICHLEKGRRIPTLATLLTLAKVLKVESETLAVVAIRDLRRRS